MKRISVLLLGVMILFTGLSSAVAPAFALGEGEHNSHCEPSLRSKHHFPIPAFAPTHA